MMSLKTILLGAAFVLILLLPFHFGIFTRSTWTTLQQYLNFRTLRNQLRFTVREILLLISLAATLTTWWTTYERANKLEQQVLDAAVLNEFYLAGWPLRPSRSFHTWSPKPTLWAEALELDEANIAPLFPQNRGWVVLPYRVHTSQRRSIHIRIDDARQGDIPLLVGHLDATTEAMEFVIAYRVVARERHTTSGRVASATRSLTVLGSDASVEGQIALATVERNKVTVIAQNEVPSFALPSRKALSRDWFDDDTSLFHRAWTIDDESRKPRFARGPTMIHIASWNGKCSSAMAEVRHPNYYGTFTIGTSMDTATSARTAKKLPGWPEPVWFVRASLAP